MRVLTFPLFVAPASPPALLTLESDLSAFNVALGFSPASCFAPWAYVVIPSEAAFWPTGFDVSAFRSAGVPAGSFDLGSDLSAFNVAPGFSPASCFAPWPYVVIPSEAAFWPTRDLLSPCF
jgi:hypothetical protein